VKPPEFSDRRPAAGEEIRRTDIVTLRTPVERPCIALRMSMATVLISHPQLEALVQYAGTIDKSADEHRKTLLRAGRAERILANAAATPDADGCHVLDERRLGDGRYLIADLLEAGLAEVIPAGATRSAGRIGVLYWGTVAGPTAGFGRIHFLVEPHRAAPAVTARPQPADARSRAVAEFDSLVAGAPDVAVPGSSAPVGFNGLEFFSIEWWSR